MPHSLPTTTFTTTSAPTRTTTNKALGILVWLRLLLLVCWLCSSVLASSGSTFTAEQHYERAKQFLIQGQTNEAMQSLEEAVQSDPADYLMRFKRAATLLSMGRNRQALEDFDAVLEMKPDFQQARLQKAKLLLLQCSLRDAKRDLNRLADLQFEMQEVTSMLHRLESAHQAIASAQTALQANRWDEAIESLSLAIDVCSQDAVLRRQRAEAHESKGDLPMAIGDYTRLLSMTTNNLEAAFHLSELHVRLGDVDPAISSLKTCLHYDPEHKKCSKLFKKLKKLSRAIQSAEESMNNNRYKEALLKDALDVDEQGSVGAVPLLKELQMSGLVQKKVYNMICECAAKLKSHDKVMRWCGLAIDADPENRQNLCYRGDSLLAKEDYDAAVRDFNKALDGGQGPNCAREGQQKAHRLQRQASRKDYYKVLGVPRDADDRHIKKAYRKLAMEYHPDKYQGDKEHAQKKMAEINEAYEVLSNPELRARFDNGDDPNDQAGGAGGGHPFGSHVVFQQGGFPFGHGGAGGGGSQFFQFHFG